MLGNSIPYKYFPFCTWIVARDDSHQTNPEAAQIHWFTSPICVCDVTGNMNIQGGVQTFAHGSHKAINVGRRVKALPKIANFIDHYTSGLFLLFCSSGNHLHIKGSLHQSLTGWYVLHYSFHFIYRIWLFRSGSGINCWIILDIFVLAYARCFAFADQLEPLTSNGIVYI